MSRQNFLILLEKPDYQSLLSVYNQHKISNQYDKFFAAVQDSKRGMLHFNLLYQQVKQIFRKLDQSKSWPVETRHALSPPSLSPPVPAPAPKSAPRPIIQSPIQQKPISITRPDHPDSLRIIKPNPHIHYEDLPDDLRQLYDAQGKLNGEMKSVHAKMRLLPDGSDAERKNCLDQLINLEETIRDNWKTLDDWYAASISPPVETGHALSSPDQSPETIAREINRCKRYIGRYHQSEKPAQQKQVDECYTILKSLGVTWSPKST